MMVPEYLAFLRAHPRPLAFGFLLAGLSSFGQTFFIALSGEALRIAFGISDGTLGTTYAVATLLSGLALGWVGRWIDRMALPHFTGMAAVPLLAGCVAMALLPGAWALVPAFFLLRMGGQGLVTHTAMTATARRFRRDAGKALALVALGFVTGEAILPPATIALLGWVGWRGMWWLAACLVVLGTAAALALLPPGGNSALAAPQVPPKAPTPPLLRDPRLLIVLPAVLAPAFVSTGFFFHQLRLVSELGWSLAVIAGAFAGFALVRAVAMLGIGPWIDRQGAARFLPIFLLPLAGSMVAILLGPGSLIAAILYMLLAGLTTGIATTLTTALWTDFYGPERLGAVRAAVAGAGVVASALAPAVFGLLLDVGIPLRVQAGGCLVYLLAASLLTCWLPRLARGR